MGKEMASSSSSSSSSSPAQRDSTKPTVTITKDSVISFFNNMGVFKNDINKFTHINDSYSDILCPHIKVQSIERGRVSCLLSVKPAIINYYGGLHGGAVAAIAERVSIACARTVVGDDKDIFLGEMSKSYLSSAPNDAEVIVDGTVVRSGRNVTVVALEFKINNSEKLVYTARATFFNSPVSKL